MIGQYIFIYLIGVSEKENEVHKTSIRSSVINTIIESYNNSWIAFNALRSDASTGKQPDMIMIDYHMLQKNGFNFLEEYQQANFLDPHKTKVYILSSAKNKGSINIDGALAEKVQVLIKPLTEEVIAALI